MCFYKGITDGHTNRRTDILDLKGLHTIVDWKKKNWNTFYVYTSIVTKGSLKHSLCHKDSKSVPKVEVNWWEVCFYKGITEGHSNRWTDRLYLKSFHSGVNWKIRIEMFSMFIGQL